MFYQPNRRVLIGAMFSASFTARLLLVGDLSLAGTQPAISPNQDFSNPILQIHAPASSGWYGISQSATKIAFGKAGSSADESYIAAVFLFRIPTFPTLDAFTEYVRQGVIKDSPADRFEVLESTVEYSPERGYPCVRYHGISNDRKAHTSALFRKNLRIEDVALYCEHPSKPGLAFSVSFSHRGGSADEKIGEDAAAFLDSIQVTPPSRAP